MSELVLGGALEAIIDHRGKTPKKLGGDFSSTGVPVASALLVRDGRLHLEEARCVSLEMYRRWMPLPTRKHDVILTSEAPLGRVALVSDDRPLVLGQRLFGLRGKPGILDSRFLYYALQTDPVQSELQGRATGTTVTGIRQSELLKVRIPPLPFSLQRSIASLLGALDDKVAANERTAQTAGKLAKAIYLSGSRCADHSVVLREVIDLCYGKALLEANRDPGDVPVFGSNGRSGWHSVALCSGPGVIVGRKGANAGSVSWSQLPFWVIDTAFYVLPKLEGIPLEYLYFLLEGVGFRNLVGDSAIPGLNREIALSCTAMLPTNEIIQRVVAEVRPLLELRSHLFAESASLAELRETLLPKLVSGDIRIRDAERIAEGVT